MPELPFIPSFATPQLVLPLQKPDGTVVKYTFDAITLDEGLTLIPFATIFRGGRVSVEESKLIDEEITDSLSGYRMILGADVLDRMRVDGVVMNDVLRASNLVLQWKAGYLTDEQALEAWSGKDKTTPTTDSSTPSAKTGDGDAGTSAPSSGSTSPTRTATTSGKRRARSGTGKTSGSST